MANKDTESTNRQGVALVGLRIEKLLGWIFREQNTSDYGVDAQVEIRESGQAKGRLLGLQIKSGSSYLKRTANGWTLRPTARHVQYWLQHSLPMYLIAVDVDAEEIYWQRLSAQTLRQTPKGGWKISIPLANTLDTAKESWLLVASGVEQEALVSYRQNLDALSREVRYHIEKVELINEVSAALLADHLAKGRSAPDFILETIFTATPTWLDSSPSAAWTAVAVFADCYRRLEYASRAYERAAQDPEGRRGRLYAAAGFRAVGIDDERANRLISKAREYPDGDTVGWIGQLVMQHPHDSALPFQVPDELGKRLKEADDVTSYSFRAQQAERLSQYSKAVRYWELAVAKFPYDTALEILLAQALMRRAESSERHYDDLAKARSIAQKALEDIRRWAGPTDVALSLLVRASAATGEYEKVIKFGASPPYGDATAEEELLPDVQIHCVHSAIMLDKYDLARAIAEKITHEPQRSQAAAWLADTKGEDATDQIARWSKALDSCSDDQAEYLIKILYRMAALKVDRSDRLDSLIDRGIVPAHIREQIRAIAAAHKDPSGSLTDLRALSGKYIGAALHLVQLLRCTGQYERAIEECERAYVRLKDRELRIVKVMLLLEKPDLGDARTEALSLLSDTSLPSVTRRQVYTKLAALEVNRAIDASESERFAEAERLCEQVIVEFGDLAPDDDAVWQLVVTQINQRAYDRAAQTVRRYQPSVRDEREGELWLKALIAEDLDADTAAHALSLAIRFAGNPRLSGALLQRIIFAPHAGSSTMQLLDNSLPIELSEVEAVVPADVIQRAFAALDEHIQRHGDAAGIRAIQLPEDPKAAIEALASHMPEQNLDLAPLVRQVRLGLMPLGMLAALLGKDYALTLVMRVVGVHVACTFVEEDYDRELEAAAAATGTSIVVETSALLISQLIDEFDELRTSFNKLFMPAASRDDIVSARIASKGYIGGIGTAGRNVGDGELFLSEGTDDERAALRQKMELVWSAANMTQSITVRSRQGLFKDDLPAVLDPWLAPLQLAHERGLPLWSDDAALRHLARSAGIPAFGTVAFLDAKLRGALEQSIDETRVQELLSGQEERVRAQVERYIVDVPVTYDLLMQIAENEGWEPGAATVLLARPSWWVWSSNPFKEFCAIIDVVSERRPEQVAHWLHAGMIGLASVSLNNISQGATYLAALVLMPLAVEDTLSLEAVVEMARGIARDWGFPDPISRAVQAGQILEAANVVTDSAEIVEAVVRQFGSGTQSYET